MTAFKKYNATPKLYKKSWHILKTYLEPEYLWFYGFTVNQEFSQEKLLLKKTYHRRRIKIFTLFFFQVVSRANIVFESGYTHAPSNNHHRYYWRFFGFLYFFLCGFCTQVLFFCIKKSTHLKKICYGWSSFLSLPLFSLLCGAYLLFARHACLILFHFFFISAYLFGCVILWLIFLEDVSCGWMDVCIFLFKFLSLFFFFFFIHFFFEMCRKKYILIIFHDRLCVCMTRCVMCAVYRGKW